MSSWGALALARVAMLAELSAAMEGSRRITWTIGVASKRERKGKLMRAIMIAMLATATIGLAGTSNTFAAPATGASIGTAVIAESLVQHAQFSRARIIRDCVHR